MERRASHVCIHDDVIKWKPFRRNWPFVRGIHRSPVNSPHKGQWRGALMFSLICVWINGWINNRDTGDYRRDRARYDVIVVFSGVLCKCNGHYHVISFAVYWWTLFFLGTFPLTPAQLLIPCPLAGNHDYTEYTSWHSCCGLIERFCMVSNQSWLNKHFPSASKSRFYFLQAGDLATLDVTGSVGNVYVWYMMT